MSQDFKLSLSGFKYELVFRFHLLLVRKGFLGSNPSYVNLKVEKIIIQWTNDCKIFFFKMGKDKFGKISVFVSKSKRKTNDS